MPIQSQISIFMVFVLCLTGCTPTQISKTVAVLDTVATSATAVVTACTAATALASNPAIAPYIAGCVTFGELLAKGASMAATELQSTDTAGVKAAEIATDLASAIQAQPKVLPPGLPADIAATVATAGSALETFLKTLDPATPTAAISKASVEKALKAKMGASSAGAKLGAVAGLFNGDHKKLNHAIKEANLAVSTAKTWRANHPAA